MKPAGMLTLYRRHTKSCMKRYEQNFRILRPRTAAEKKKDCECPIVCDGTLRHESKRLCHVSLETNNWDTAEARAKGWEQWQATTDPSTSITSKAVPTIREACEKFMEFHGPKGLQWGCAYLQKFEHTFGLRLIPYATQKKLSLADFDEKQVVNGFVTSWRNTNPLRNRKPKPGEVTADTLPTIRAAIPLPTITAAADRKHCVAFGVAAPTEAEPLCGFVGDHCYRSR